jgi:hypothetical protein
LAFLASLRSSREEFPRQ